MDAIETEDGCISLEWFRTRLAILCTHFVIAIKVYNHFNYFMLLLIALNKR